MCGCITRTSAREAIAKEFGVTRFAEVDRHPRYNVAPSQVVETIISVNSEKRRGQDNALGVVSPTAKEPKLAPINTRAVTVSTSPIFRDAFRRHRLQPYPRRREISAELVPPGSSRVAITELCAS